MKYFFIALLIGLSFNVFAQNASMYRTIYYPAEPYGGEKGFKEMVKLCMVYPEEALKKDISGEVFITFKVNSKGQVIFKELSKNTDPLLSKEASRIFDQIMWIADTTRDDNDLGFEKIMIAFKPKKYNKLIKKRGYDKLPLIENRYNMDFKTFDINSVDKKPSYSNIESLNVFLKNNFKYPAIALQQNLSGRVTVKFVIEPYGMASNIQVIEPVGGGCNDETIRLVRLMRWNPAERDGKPVRCISEYQLNFVNPGATIR